MEEVLRISLSKQKNLIDTYKSKSVRKLVKEIFRRKSKPGRSDSKQSVTTSRVSLNTISSLGRLGNTIDASKDSFRGYIGASNDKPLQPENIRLRLISDSENIPTNVGLYKGRNNASLSSLHSKTINSNAPGFKMIKSNTLTKLKPNQSIEFQRQSLMQTKKQPEVYASLHCSNYPGDEINKNETLRAGDSRFETLNNSYCSNKNVDFSDIVLKGDVKDKISRNGSIDQNSKTLKMDQVFKKQLNTLQFTNTQEYNAISSSKQPNHKAPNNYRYGGADAQNDFCELMMSPKESPDLSKYVPKIKHGVEFSQQNDLVLKLQNEVAQLKHKLQYYEQNCK